MNKALIFAGWIFCWSTAYGQDSQAAADDVCACFEEPYQLIEQVLADVEAAQAEGNYAALLEQQGEMLSVMGAAQSCFDELPAKYPEIDQNPELQYEVLAIANEQCPNPAENFNFGG